MLDILDPAIVLCLADATTLAIYSSTVEQTAPMAPGCCLMPAARTCPVSTPDWHSIPYCAT